MEQNRIEFVSAAVSKEKSISELCREYGITRKTGYKWINRYKAGESLTDKSHVPFKTPNKTAAETEELILECRDSHPAWGARKIKRNLEDKGFELIPAASTVADILKRNQRIEPEESEKHKAFKRFEHEQPNDLWQMDFKGDFGMLDGTRCYALTVLDDHSRFNLCLEAMKNQQAGSVMGVLKRIFTEYGVPRAILCDNGKPWGDSKGGHTSIELWLMQNDILPIHGRPWHPQTQGKDERFHRTMDLELLKRVVIANLQNAQELFDPWRHEYNYERPHGALNLDVPAKHYKRSKRVFCDTVREPEYERGARLRKVNYKGYLSINNHRYFISDSLIGKYLEIRDVDEDCIALNYGDFQVSKLNIREQILVSRRIYRVARR